MSEELKPCPFCGGRAEIKSLIHEILLVYVVRVICDNCGAQAREFKTREMAAEAWNRRDGNGEGNRAFYNRVCDGVCDD